MVALAHADCGRGGWGRPNSLRSSQSNLPALFIVFALAGCAVGPDYVPEAAPTPKDFKELKGWKVATPIDHLPRGEWWAFYHDPKLDFLIKQVEISNQTVAAQAAAYEQARALIREAQATLFPTLNAAYSASHVYSGALVSGTGMVINTPQFMPQLSGTWISMYGARFAAKSKATLPPRKPVPPRSIMPSSRRRRCWPLPISI